MGKWNEDVFEGAVEIVSAAMEESEVELTKEGGRKVAEFFAAVYAGLAALADEDEEDEEDDEDEDDEGEGEEDGEDEDDDDEDDEGEDDDDEDDEGEDDDDEDDEGEDEEDGGDSGVNGGKPVKRGAFELYRDNSGAYRFRLRAVNGEIVAVSEGYQKKESCLKGIESVRKNAAAAVLREA